MYKIYYFNRINFRKRCQKFAKMLRITFRIGVNQRISRDELSQMSNFRFFARQTFAKKYKIREIN